MPGTGVNDENETLAKNHTVSMQSKIFGQKYNMGLNPKNNLLQSINQTFN